MPNLVGLIPNKLVFPLIAVLLVAIIVLTITGLSAPDLAGQLCAELKQQGAEVCVITHPQLVQTDTGDSFLVIGKRIFKIGG